MLGQFAEEHIAENIDKSRQLVRSQIFNVPIKVINKEIMEI